jgi:hypothetical protein
MAHDAFISHSSHDKPVADAVCATLESRGIRCWIAPRDILPGESWPKAIMQGIHQSQAMVVVFSAHSNTSQPVMNEVERAVHNNLVIIPFRIEDVAMTDEMEFFLSTRHWLDAMTGPLESHLSRLADQVCHVLLPRDPESPGTASPTFADPVIVRADVPSQHLDALAPSAIIEPSPLRSPPPQVSEPDRQPFGQQVQPVVPAARKIKPWHRWLAYLCLFWIGGFMSTAPHMMAMGGLFYLLAVTCVIIEVGVMVVNWIKRLAVNARTRGG